MNAVKTNNLVVVSTSREKVTVAINGTNRTLTWDDLRAAASAHNGVEGLRRVYLDLLTEAERIGESGPVDIEVCHDHTGVWWVVRVHAAHGGHSAAFHRHADEGGTHGRYESAASEARGICKRLGDRVERRIGF